MLKPVTGVMFGCDPELFAERDGRVIGSEKVIPIDGLLSRNTGTKVVQDGVQIELNPTARNSVARLGQEISLGFHLIHRQLARHKGVKLNWSRFLEVSREELMSLRKENQQLGCQPSKNVYGDNPMTCDVETYPKRGAGGHLHFGLPEGLKRKRQHLVPLFDIFVGNTFVMLDRDPGMAERRENYGRAGEYRDENQPDPVTNAVKPHHGLEYRTLSSVWLRNYTLMSLAFGLADIALSVIAQGGKPEEELIESVNIDNVIKAIDTNNFDLARSNFDTIRPWMLRNLPKHGFQLAPDNLIRFVVLTSWIRQDGLEEFFKQDPLQHWLRGEQVEFQDWIQKIK